MKKRVLLLFVCALALMMFSGCKWDQPEREPDRQETVMVTDANGTHPVTYRYYDSPDDRAVDPSFYKYMVMMGAVFSVMSLYCFYRANEVSRLKKRCTESVPATVLFVRKSKNWDRLVRFRYSMYNATYSYDYDGLPYESSGDYYGRSTTFRFNEMKPGDSAEIKIDPSQPRRVYDVFAAYIGRYFLTFAIFLGLCAAASFIAYFVV